MASTDYTMDTCFVKVDFRKQPYCCLSKVDFWKEPYSRVMFSKVFGDLSL